MTVGRRLLHASPWLAPLLVAVVCIQSPERLDELLLVGLGATAVLVVAGRPDICVLAILAFTPFQLFVPAVLYRVGVPEGVLRPLAAWREVLALGLSLAALRALVAARRRLDAIDLLAIAFVAIITLHAVAPRAFADDAPLELSTRALAWRSSALFVALLLAARHATLGPDVRAKAVRVVCTTAVVVSAFALWEFVDSSSWNHVATRWFHVNHYRIDVLDHRGPLFELRTFGSLGDREFVRVSSLLVSPLPLGHYLVIPLTLALHRGMRTGRVGPGIQATVIAAALVCTQTRSAILGAAVAVVVLFAATRGDRGLARRRRQRFGQLFVAAGLAVLPAVVALGLAARITDDESNAAHLDSFSDGIEALVDHPLGRGLGTSAGVGMRVGNDVIVAENYYLQVANEVGIVAGIVFVALVGLVLVRLWRGRDAADPFVVAALAGFAGITVAAAFLHAYTDQSVAWTAFLVAGLGLGAIERPDHEPADDATYPASASLP